MMTDGESLSAASSLQSYCHWDSALKSFLTRLGLVQTLRGFESDMLVLNEEWERSNVPVAVENLVKDLSADVQNHSYEPSEAQNGRPLDDRKLDHVHFAYGVEPRSQTSVSSSV